MSHLTVPLSWSLNAPMSGMTTLARLQAACPLWAAFLALLVPASLSAGVENGTDDSPRIIIGERAPELESYAAKELQRYLWHLCGAHVPIVTDSEGRLTSGSFVLGQSKTNSIINEARKQEKLQLSEG